MVLFTFRWLAVARAHCCLARVELERVEKLFVAAPLRLAVLVVGSNAVARLHVAFRLNTAFAFSIRTRSVLKERMIFTGRANVIFAALRA